jgi:hypothetical protein
MNGRRWRIMCGDRGGCRGLCGGGYRCRGMFSCRGSRGRVRQKKGSGGRGRLARRSNGGNRGRSQRGRSLYGRSQRGWSQWGRSLWGTGFEGLVNTTSRSRRVSLIQITNSQNIIFRTRIFTKRVNSQIRSSSGTF